MSEANVKVDMHQCTDWTPDSSNLDEVWAWRTLDGLDREGAIRMLAVNPSTLTEALHYSKGRCFEHFLGVLLDYLLSDEAKSNFAAASGFMDLLVARRPQPDLHIGLRSISLQEGAHLVASRQEFYEADADILGDFGVLYRKYVGS